MKLLFIQGGSRWKFDTDGNVYTDANFSEDIWNRYRSYCDELTVILRREENIYSEKDAKSRFNCYDVEKSKYVSLPDIYRPIRNAFRISLRRKIDAEISKAVINSDRVIIRSVGNFYTNTAVKYAKKYKKSFLIEVTGFAFESLWYHSLIGKIVAIQREYSMKSIIKNVSYAVYVTEKALQKRYPCSGLTLGCSDVELSDLDEKILDRRIKKIEEKHSKFVIGTAAFLDVKWKGQEQVIRAIAKLKDQGITNIEYRLAGAGKGKKIISLAKKLGVVNQVYLIGALPHEQVFAWLDEIDIYVQPSFQEGLCRSIVEAMSRACPVVASDVGGNYELVERDYLFSKGNILQLIACLKRMMKPDVMKKAAMKNFETAKHYQKEILDKKRDEFYYKFLKS